MTDKAKKKPKPQPRDPSSFTPIEQAQVKDLFEKEPKTQTAEAAIEKARLSRGQP